MPGFIHQVENDQILLGTIVADFDENDEPSGELRMCQGLLDTGAQRTAVSPRIVADLGLVPVDIGRMVVASGEVQDILIYQVGIGVAMPTAIEITQGDAPDNLRLAERTESSGKLLRVMGLPQQPDNFDVLLGMDLLSMYHISLTDGLFLMSL